MSTELIDTKDISALVRDKIKSQLFSLIPDEKIDALIKKEYVKFFEYRRYNNDDTEFEKLVKGVLTEEMTIMCKERLKQFAKEIYKDGKLNETLLPNVVKELTPIILEIAMRKIIFDVSQGIDRYR